MNSYPTYPDNALLPEQRNDSKQAMLLRYSKLGLCLSSRDEPAPTLPQLSRAMDEGIVRSLCQLKRDPEACELMEAEVTLVVVDLWQWFGANDSSVRLAPQLVKQIINTYPHMYIDDLRIFAEQARASSFGKVYGSFSPSTMMEWLRTYWNDRQRAMEEESYAQHLSLKEAGNYSASASDRYFANLADKKTMKLR